jgi:superkiller protein 3
VPPVHLTGTAYDRGQTYLKARSFTAAVAQFRLSIRRHQSVADSYANIGTASLDMGKDAAAYRAYKAAVSHNPSNAAYLYYAAYSALYAQDFRGAVSYATRFIGVQAKNPAGYHLRFLAYGKLLEHKNQVTDARVEVQLQPRSPDSYNDLGIALTNDGKFAAAVKTFTRAIRLRPAYLSYYTNRAMAENLNRQPNDVLRDLYTARSLAKDSLTKKQIDEAIANFKKHLKQ